MSRSFDIVTSFLRGRGAVYVLLLGTVLLNLTWTFGSMYFDSVVYVEAASYFLGSGELEGVLVFRPVVPFLASLLSPVFGLEGSFAVLSSLFWLGASVLIYHSVGRLSGSEKVGLWTALFFNFSVPVLMFGGAVLTDMASWFFLAFGLYLLAEWRKRTGLSWFAAAGLLAGVGILTRETVLALPVMAVLLVVSLGRRLVVADVFRLVVFLFFAFLPAAVWMWSLGGSLLVYYHHAVLGPVRRHIQPDVRTVPWEGPLYGLFGVDAGSVPWFVRLAVRYAVPVSASFHITLVVLLAWWRDSFSFLKDLRLWPLLLATAAAFLSVPGAERRLAFVLFPVMLPLAAMHSTRLRIRAMLPLFGGYAVASLLIISLFPWQ